MPRIVSHAGDATSTIDIQNYKQTVVIDPTLAWWKSGSGSADRGALTLHGPKGDESFDFGPLSVNYATTVNPDQTVSTAIKEEIDDIAFKVSGPAKDGAAVNASGQLDKIALHLGADGLKIAESLRPGEPPLRPPSRPRAA